MNPEQKQAALAAFDAWAEPQIAAASAFTRGAIREYFAKHKEEIIDVIGTAVVAVTATEEKS